MSSRCLEDVFKTCLDDQQRFAGNIFTSKISNLLLPLGAEAVRSRESYPTNDISNKYIYDAFIMSLFIYFLVVVFTLFGNSNELIKDSRRL